MLSQVLRNRQY